MSEAAERTPVEELSGRELDARVHEEVMNIRLDPPDCGCTDCLTGRSGHRGDQPAYSSDLNTAWALAREVVQEMRRVTLEWFPDSSGAAVAFEASPQKRWMGYGGSAGEAICRAALKAVRSE